MAQLAAWLLAPWSKKRITAEKLLKKRPPRQPLIPGDVIPIRHVEDDEEPEP